MIWIQLYSPSIYFCRKILRQNLHRRRGGDINEGHSPPLEKVLCLDICSTYTIWYSSFNWEALFCKDQYLRSLRIKIWPFFHLFTIDHLRQASLSLHNDYLGIAAKLSILDSLAVEKSFAGEQNMFNWAWKQKMSKKRQGNRKKKYSH